jgi:RNA 2',3'-cyclic 3'-phosphodiesterase
MLRLFVGIELPPELKLQLSILCSGLASARWVDAGNYHVTIRFIGEVDEGVANDIDVALARIRAKGFAVALAGIATFGGRQLYAGVEKNEALGHLRDKVESALVRLGLEPEGRKYTPHVTLARLKGPDPRLEAYLHEHALYRAAPFEVRQYTLIASYPTKSGSIYEDQALYPLA